MPRESKCLFPRKSVLFPRFSTKDPPAYRKGLTISVQEVLRGLINWNHRQKAGEKPLPAGCFVLVEWLEDDANPGVNPDVFGSQQRTILDHEGISLRESHRNEFLMR